MERTETLAFMSLAVNKNLGGEHGAERTEHRGQVLVGEIVGKVVDEEVGTNGALLVKRGRAAAITRSTASVPATAATVVRATVTRATTVATAKVGAAVVRERHARSRARGIETAVAVRATC